MAPPGDVHDDTPGTELRNVNGDSSGATVTSKAANDSTGQQPQSRESSKASVKAWKFWSTIAAELLGSSLSWTQEPAYEYTDKQPYPFQCGPKEIENHERIDTVLSGDRYQFKKLKVQATQAVQNQKNATWDRHSIGEVRTTTIAIGEVPLLSKDRFDERFRHTGWGPFVTWIWYFFIYIFSLTTMILWTPIRILKSKKPGLEGYGYERFHYEDDKYPRIAANPFDNRKEHLRVRYDQPLKDGVAGTYDQLRPRMLVQTNGDDDPVLVRDYPDGAKYVFIAWSALHFDESDERQAELLYVSSKITQSLEMEYFWVSASCMELNEAEERLSKEERTKLEQRDIYGISDVIRGAAKVIIVLPSGYEGAPPPPWDMKVSKTLLHRKSEAAQAVNNDLKTWGNRVWTFPEVLLGPEEPITICWLKGAQIQRYELEKNEFPGHAWADEATSKQMVNHYRNTALTRLEFIKIAMTCLMNRSHTGIGWWYPGDLSYVLMGFLRIRPPIDKYDSSLQAFARLSLPADSDRLMERFISLQWPDRSSYWANMDDGFKSDLWSIQPYIQVSGVGENDTVIIEKAWGARIELEKFDDISAVALTGLRRLQGVMGGFAIDPRLVRKTAKWFREAKYKGVHPRLYCFEGFLPIEEIEAKFFGAPIGYLKWSKNTSTLSKHGPGKAVYEPKTGLSGDEGKAFAGLDNGSLNGIETDLEAQASVNLGPEALQRRRSGEGDRGGREAEPETGEDTRRTSRASILHDDGRIATYPMKGLQPWQICKCGSETCQCPYTSDRALQAKSESALGEDKIFTLIDTATMTVTLLEAAWPPQALIACAVEGGMERVLACSYDWTTGVLYKECVLRFPGVVLEQMHRLSGVRLGLRRTLRNGDVAPTKKAKVPKITGAAV